MGKGDKRTRKGKIFAKSYGKTRPHRAKKSATAKTTKPKSGTTATKTGAKKSTGKK